ncbi:MAG: UDP-3-O-acyl-N-acetylglucosamine deacetylase [Kiritimatiellae bacterium]|nr:UDP-3-O-acyl-N-acetylglucosamine deacetylase [Kiritimatiellia bacterium]
MDTQVYGKILSGDEESVKLSSDKLLAQSVDLEIPSDPEKAFSEYQTTIGGHVSVSGPGTFSRKEQSRLVFEPSEESGWWIDRVDQADSLNIGVGIGNVWTTARNIVLRSGSAHNYLRMVEHIIALRVGMGLDNVLLRLRSGDPPLFDRSSMDLVEGVEDIGIVDTDKKAIYVGVKEPVTIVGPNGSFLTILPPENGSRELYVDCAVDFKTAIGKQRIKFPVNRDTFRTGAFARTNAPLSMMIYCKTVGQLFADTRHLGYTTRNILIAGPWGYVNAPRLMHEGKAMEAVWHRATLDLLAAIALIDKGRLAGTIISYKAGHALDVDMVAALYRDDMLEEL